MSQINGQSHAHHQKTLGGPYTTRQVFFSISRRHLVIRLPSLRRAFGLEKFSASHLFFSCSFLGNWANSGTAKKIAIRLDARQAFGWVWYKGWGGHSSVLGQCLGGAGRVGRRKFFFSFFDQQELLGIRRYDLIFRVGGDYFDGHVL